MGMKGLLGKRWMEWRKALYNRGECKNWQLYVSMICSQGIDGLLVPNFWSSCIHNHAM